MRSTDEGTEATSLCKVSFPSSVAPRESNTCNVTLVHATRRSTRWPRRTALTIVVSWILAVGSGCSPKSTPLPSDGAQRATQLIQSSQAGNDGSRQLSRNLQAIGDDAIGPAAESLAKADFDTIVQITLFLAEADDQKVKERLIPLVKSKDPHERTVALAMIDATLDTVTTVKVLQEMINDPSPLVRRTVLLTGVHVPVRGHEFDHAYREGLKSEILEDRLISSWKLAVDGDFRGLKNVRDALHSSDERIVDLAIDALHSFPRAVAISELNMVRKSAPRSLHRRIQNTIGIFRE